MIIKKIIIKNILEMRIKNKMIVMIKKVLDEMIVVMKEYNVIIVIIKNKVIV